MLLLLLLHGGEICRVKRWRQDYRKRRHPRSNSSTRATNSTFAPSRSNFAHNQECLGFASREDQRTSGRDVLGARAGAEPSSLPALVVYARTSPMRAFHACARCLGSQNDCHECATFFTRSEPRHSCCGEVAGWREMLNSWPADEFRRGFRRLLFLRQTV